MKAVFADTFFFLAAVNRDDPGHEAAIEWSDAYHGPLLTTVWVVTEVADALAGLSHRPVFEAFYETVKQDPRMRIIPADQSLWERSLTFYLRRLDKEWSLTDCISFTVMNDEGVTDALTGDRHFRQAGFNALLENRKN